MPKARRRNAGPDLLGKKRQSDPVPRGIMPSSVVSMEDAAKVLLQRRAMRENLEPFTLRVFQHLRPADLLKYNWHIGFICEHLEMAWDRDPAYQQLALCVPPRSLKSIIASIAFTAWGLGKEPSEQFLCGSYGASLSLELSVDTRTVIESNWYKKVFPDVQITSDQNQKQKFSTTQRGHRIATSVGGAAVGQGGNILIMDDALKAEEAYTSRTEINKTNDWMDQVWSTRKNDPLTAIEILIMQRLDINDPVGHLTKDGDWKIIKLPQVSPVKHVLIFPKTKKKVTRDKGELLHAERNSADIVAKIKRRLGTFGFAAQQQQDPVSREGGRITLSMFPRYKRTLPQQLFEEVVLSADTASKPKEINDPSVIEVYGRLGGQWYLADLWKDQVRYSDLKRRAKLMAGHWKPDAFLIEDKSSGMQLIQDLQDETDLAIIPIEPEADKITRMEVRIPDIEAGIVTLPHEDLEVAWLPDLELALTSFPSPPFWDEIDAMSQFLKWNRKRHHSSWEIY